MPKAKQKSRRRESDDSDDDVAEPSQLQSQPTMTQAQKASADFSPEEIERRENDLVQYLLIMDQKKQPIKKLDINNAVLKEMKKLFPAMIASAQQKLRDVFGIELLELESKKGYILINKLDLSSDKPHLKWTDLDNQKSALLMITLSLIFMNNNVLSEADLWHTLRRLDIEQDRRHEVFGDVKKLITREFVQQGYLLYTKIPASEPPKYEFTWGERSRAETKKRYMLSFVCQMYGNDIRPEQWTSQYQDVERTEGPMTDEEAAMDSQSDN